MNKQGFTIAETLIVLAIIGVLIMAAITTIKPFDKTIQYLYTNAAISLDRAYYNAMGVSGSDDPFADASETFVRNSTTRDDGAKRVCEALIKYINPIDKADSCKADRIVSPKADSFPDDKIQFQSLNGMRFYTSNLVTGTYNTQDIQFYIVFVDVNGEKGRGSAEYVPGGTKDENGNEMKQKNPDIFAFGILPIGRVVPLGPPEIDTTFMSTRISYLNDEQEVRFSTVSKPYYQTKADAWGYYIDDADNTRIAYDTPYTYNDAIKTILNAKYEDNLIYKNVEIPTTTRDEALLNGTASEKSPHCLAADAELEAMIETCTLHIDNYAF